MTSAIERDQFGIGTQMLASRQARAAAIIHLNVSGWFPWRRTFQAFNFDALQLFIPFLLAVSALFDEVARRTVVHPTEYRQIDSSRAMGGRHRTTIRYFKTELTNAGESK